MSVAAGSCPGTLPLPLPRDRHRLAGVVGARCRELNVRSWSLAVFARSEDDLAYVAGESGIATFAAVTNLGLCSWLKSRCGAPTKVLCQWASVS
jgi:hypothetical protein